jgi:hypothetical protein
VAKTQETDGSPPDPDLLAAVVLYTLVTEGREGISAVRVALACERNPHSRGDMEEIEAALKLLGEDGLAQREGADGAQSEERVELFRPTRAAVRAGELSF